MARGRWRRWEELCEAEEGVGRTGRSLVATENPLEMNYNGTGSFLKMQNKRYVCSDPESSTQFGKMKAEFR